jgi:pantothenate kinase type III
MKKNRNNNIIKKTNYSPVAVDIGNSRIKMLYQDKFHATEYKTDWEREILNFIIKLPATNLLFGCSSVNEIHFEAFCKIAEIIKNSSIIDVSSLLPRQKILDYSDINGIGDDRLLGLIGAMASFRPPLITVDCGTAVTINAVAQDGNCLGGAIFAGAYTQMNALARDADNLFNFKFIQNNKASGRTTEQAMSSGILNSIVGGIRELVNKISHEEFNGKKPPLFITGGNADMIILLLKDGGFSIYPKPYLVLEGILKLMEIVEFEI